MSRLSEIQREVGRWQRATWPGHQNPYVKACKLGEEAGEVLGAVIKVNEGRKTVRDIENEPGDVVIALMGLAEVIGFDLEMVIAGRWHEVQARVYQPATPDEVALIETLRTEARQ